jgi:hypothetical protein
LGSYPTADCSNSPRVQGSGEIDGMCRVWGRPGTTASKRVRYLDEDTIHRLGCEMRLACLLGSKRVGVDSYLAANRHASGGAYRPHAALPLPHHPDEPGVANVMSRKQEPMTSLSVEESLDSIAPTEWGNDIGLLSSNRYLAPECMDCTALLVCDFSVPHIRWVVDHLDRARLPYLEGTGTRTRRNPLSWRR